MATLSIRGVGKRFGPTVVLRDISLDLQGGEFVAILGASGCGKSTLLRIVAGLERLDSGSIHIAGEDVGAVPPDRRDLAMVFQSHSLYPQMTVAGNIALPLEMRRLKAWQRLPGMGVLPGIRRIRGAITADVRQAAAVVGLETLLERRPSQLSGGQRQRAALARAMVRRPRLLLMDEPLSSLDAKLRQRMRREISDLHRSSGATVLYVTHDQVEAMTMADRVAVMVEGRIVQIGSPQALYDDPADLRVAEMLGGSAVNLLKGRSSPQGVEAAGRLWPLASAFLGDVLLGFRPEHGRLVPSDGPGAGRIERVEKLGAERLTQIRLPTGEAVQVRQDAHDPLGLEDRVELTVEPGRLLLFEPGGPRIAAEASR